MPSSNSLRVTTAPLLVRLLAAAAVAGGLLVAAPAPASPADSYCAGDYDTHPHVAGPLRFGVDPGVAGNPVPGGSVAPTDRRQENVALRGLRRPGTPLVVRLNRLFWSRGERALRRFAHREHRLSADGFDVEVQVRYHPTAREEGDMHAWRGWVAHVVDVLARDPALVALTITNETNLDISPNTSDGSYQRAWPALVNGIESAHRQLVRRGWSSRVRLGFTFAYRFNPQRDANFWQFLAQHGGRRFVAALGFVGLDDYPGTFYPPVLAPGSPLGSSPGQALVQAAATMRDCYLAMGRIPRSVPLWVTENGFPSRGGRLGEPGQRDALVEMVTAAHAVAGTYGVSDYRWFNLRDNNSNGTGMFDTDGLLRDDYSRKPAYDAYRRLIARFGITG